MKPLQIGDVVGDYRVIGIVGSGGMGAVYKIEHVITNRIEAMKLLPPGSGNDPDQMRRFEREIQVQARLHHPNIVTLYNAVRDGDTIALVMEFVDGESLRRKLETGALPVATAVDYVSQVLLALSCAHAAGVIHRDVAPANIIVTRDGVAKLTDFGLARGARDLRLSSSGSPLGSPWYMSPEQVKGAGAVDARTDIYAMGAVFHEMLTGEKLFDADGAYAVMRAQVEAAPPRPSSRNPRVPAALDNVVLKALAKDPEMRFASADEFRLAVQYVVAGVPSPVVPAVPPDSREITLPPLALRRHGFRPSRAALLMAVVPAALAAGFCTIRFFPAAPQSRPADSKPPAVLPVHPPAETLPAVAAPADPEASVVAPSMPPEEPEQPAPARPRSLRSRQALSRAGKAAPDYSIRVTGAEQPAPVVVASPRPDPAARLAEASAPAVPAAPKVNCDVAPLTPVPASSVAAPPDAPPAPDPATAEKPQSTGNPLARALGKVNPFRKKAKYDTSEAAQTPVKKD
jgi:serine/threonine-protein kinase